MPHINSRSGGDDLASTDEVKVYNDEGAEEIEQRSSEKILCEDKLGLVKETEQDKSTISGRGFPVAAKSAGGSEDKSIGPPPTNDHVNHIGYFYRPYTNGATSLTASGKVPAVGFQPHPGLMTYGDIMTQPPPAHSGIQVVPAMHIGYKAGLPRSSIFPIPASSQYSMYPDFMPGWPGAAGYAMPPVGGFHATPYMHYMAAAAVAGGLLPPHPSLSPHSPVGLPQSALIGQGLKQDGPLQHHVYDAAAVAAAAATRFSSNGLGSSSSGGATASNGDQPAHGGSSRHHSDGSPANPMTGGGGNSLGTPTQPSAAEKKMRVHIKKPLNAFMLFMKEMRSSVVTECTLKESAAINQILGRKWHELDRAQQAKYYDMAKKEREQHMKLYPGWSARDNYAMHSKKKKKLKDGGRGSSSSVASAAAASSSSSSSQGACSAGSAATAAAGLDGDTGKECMHPKKCRARFGLDKQSQWCKPCRRSAAAAAYGGCQQQQPSSATPYVPAAAAAAAAASPGFCRRKKKCVIQHLSDAQVLSTNGNGGGSFDNSLSDDNDCDISADAADNYHSQASANDLDDSNGDDLIMDHDDDDVHDVDDDNHENRGDADVRLATHMHQLSTQRSRALAPAAAGSAAAAAASAGAIIDRTRRDTSAGAIMQEQGQEL